MLEIDKKLAGWENPPIMLHVAEAGRSCVKAMVRCLLPGVAAAFFLSSFHTVALAQEEYESKVPERETAAQRESRRTAKSAQQQQTGAPVTYENVLADPDNEDLNYRYAGTQIGKGDLKGAAATLERLLLVNPALARVRLLYAIVLFRLDNLDEAERAFQAVAGMKIPPSLRDEVDDYLRQIRLRRKRTRMAASITAGFQYDTNRNASPSSKRRLLADTPVIVSGTSRKRPDTSVIGVQSVEITHDLGMQGGHQVWGSFDHYIAEQTYVDDLDIQSFGLEAGANLYTGPFTIVPSGFTNHIRLSRETFLRTHGFNVTVERPVSPKLNLLGGFRWAWEDYVPIYENLASPEREGDVRVLTYGGKYVLNPRMRLSVIGTFTDKNAKATYFDYEGFAFQVTHTWLLGWGQFLTTSLTQGINTYDNADTAISVVTRQDEQYRARMTYGIPVDLMTLQMLPKSIVRDLILTFTVEQFRSDSNVTNYSYRNTKASAMLTKSFEF